jgi:hypothetical protein
MLATLAALVVGKAVITANAIPFITRFDRAPLIQPILFKTAVYWVAVFVARLAERFVYFAVVDGHRPGDAVRRHWTDMALVDPRAHPLHAALGFALIPPDAPELRLLRRRFDATICRCVG